MVIRNVALSLVDVEDYLVILELVVFEYLLVFEILKSNIQLASTALIVLDCFADVLYEGY